MVIDARPADRAPLIWIYGAAVAANYVAQVPYTLHPYGTAFSRSGAILLGATLVWFILAVGLFLKGRSAGYWLLLGYAVAQSLFYFDTEAIGALRGYGLPYHLTQTHDLILWLTFVCGDVNFLAALAMVFYLLTRRRRLARGESTSH